MNVADRKSQELRLHAELSRVSSSLESAYSALGKVIYSHPVLADQAKYECPGEYGAVTSLLSDVRDLRDKIENLQRQAAMFASPTLRQSKWFACVKCGTPVTLDLAYCPSCGDNLAELKGQHRMCPSCGTYHTSDSMFCMQCGSRTVEVPVASTIQNPIMEERAQSDGTLESRNSAGDGFQTYAPDHIAGGIVTDESAAGAPMPTLTQPICPSCGAVISTKDAFCGECGMRLMD